MRTVPKISFVVDCDSEVGWGHFVRSHALAGELRRLQCDVDFFVNGAAPPFASPQDGVVTGLPYGNANLPLGVANPDAIVLDLRAYSPDTVAALPDSALLVVLVDGPDPPFRTDLTVDANVSSEGTSHDTRLAGGGFVILRPGFDRAPVLRETKDADSLLISFGGTVRSAMLSHALDAARTSAFSRITVVAPTQTLARATSATAEAWNPSRVVSLLDSVPDIPKLLLEVDAALVAAGTLLHEACATALPTASLSLSPEQHVEAKAIGKQGGTLYLGPAERLKVEDIAEAMTQLGNGDTRAALSAHAHTLVDGKGRRRVADQIMALLGARAGSDRR